jgi:predicted TIM-barrel fold metal-dependent hydrolase
MKCIDVHVHDGRRSVFTCRSTVEEKAREVSKILTQFEIEKGVLSSIVAIAYDFIEGNREAKEIIEKDERLYGYVVVNANYPEESIGEIEKYVKHKKFIGIKNHPFTARQPINSINNQKIIEHVQKKKYDLPILFHTYGEADAEYVIEITRKFPGQKIIMAHMGGPEADRAMTLLGEVRGTCRNVYIDPCCSHPDADKIKIARDKIGISRILFGSDLPFISPAMTLGMVESSDLSLKEKQKILYENALDVFNWNR